MNTLIYLTSKWLELFKLDDSPRRKPRAKPAPAPVQVVTIDRRTLENRAACIKIYEGYCGPIWDEVRKMTNKQLLEIINQ